eukprot:14609544-Alexandrium_andersonii.AAC.1
MPWQRPGTLAEQIGWFCDHVALDDRCYSRLRAAHHEVSRMVVEQDHWAAADNMNKTATSTVNTLLFARVRMRLRVCIRACAGA